jgi:hypothetical protein
MKTIRRILTGIVFATPLLLSASAYAAPNTLVVSGPSTVSADAAAITIAIDADLGSTPIPVLDAYVTFDPAKLEFVGINYSGSPFTADTIDAASGTNFYKISRYSTASPYPSGAAVIAKISFRPKVSSGTTVVSIDKPQSGLYTEAGADALVGTVSHTITFTAPPVNPATPPPATATPPAAPSATVQQKPTTTPAVAQTTATPTAASSETAPAAQPQGSVTYKQTAYGGGASSAVSFFAKTPVRIGLITAVSGSLLITAYFATAGLRQRRYVQMATSQTAVLPPNPVAGGITLGYDPTVIQPQGPKQPTNGEGPM